MNLLGEDILQSVHIFILADGVARTYTTEPVQTLEMAEIVTKAILRAGMWYAESHGLEVAQIGALA